MYPARSESILAEFLSITCQNPDPTLSEGADVGTIAKNRRASRER